MNKIIGITGKAGAGKDIAGTMFQESIPGSNHVGVSDYIRELATKGDLRHSRENLVLLGEEIQRDKGDSFLAKKVVDEISPNVVTIITGLRQLGQIDFLRENCRFHLIGITASAQIRYERLIANRKFSGTYEEFITQDGYEGNSDVLNVSKCLSRSNYTIENNHGIRELESRISEVVGKVLEDFYLRNIPL